MLLFIPETEREISVNGVSLPRELGAMNLRQYLQEFLEDKQTFCSTDTAVNSGSKLCLLCYADLGKLFLFAKRFAKAFV